MSAQAPRQFLQTAHGERAVDNNVQDVRIVDENGDPVNSGPGSLVDIDQTTPGTTNGVVIKANPSTTAVTGTQAVKTVASSGTPERMAAATLLCESVQIEGKKDRTTNNTGNIWIGWTSGNDTQLLQIGPGEIRVIEAPAGKKLDLNLIYIDVATNADGVIYTALN